MMYGIPECAISCYLILFVMKADGVESMVMAIAVTVLISLVVGLVFLLIHFTIESAVLRMSVLVISSYLFLWLGSASKIGPVGSIIALVIAFVMTLLSDIPLGEAATRGLLYAWLMAVAPMLLIVVFNLAVGRKPQDLLRRCVMDRVAAAGAYLRQPTVKNFAAVQALLQEEQNPHKQRIQFVRLFHLLPRETSLKLESAIIQSYRLLLAVSVLPLATPDPVRFALAQLCNENISSDEQEREPVEISVSPEVREIREVLDSLAKGEIVAKQTNRAEPFFRPDAFSDRGHARFALKTTAAALICYLIYTALDWQDIHTAMITCYVAALGTTGETVHKLLLRIAGCLIGALMGMLSIVFIIPHADGIGELMALVFAGILLAAWVSSGSERISYAGIQIGLAFLMTVLQGFGPSTSLDVAQDRVLGILLGNVVMYLMFTLVWPVPIVHSVRQRLKEAAAELSRLQSKPAEAGGAALRETQFIEEQLGIARQQLGLIPFEPAALRPSKEEVVQLRQQISALNFLCLRAHRLNSACWRKGTSS
ncbi:FUSC family protein [Enterobacteriaceae bacterium 89]|nr:FUSC family protein [Enterobacteriaceae bacterium 89]